MSDVNFQETIRERFERLRGSGYGRTGGSAADQMSHLECAVQDGHGDKLYGTIGTKMLLDEYRKREV